MLCAILINETRPRIIHKLLSKEEQYVHDLNVVESVYIEPLRNSGLDVSSGNLQEFVDEVFGNITQVRDINKRLLEALYVRQREQAPVVGGIGDIFLDAATTDFKEVYPTYIGHYPIAERLLREELERNPDFRMFIEVRVYVSTPGLTFTTRTRLAPEGR